MFVEATPVIHDQPTSVVSNRLVPKLNLDDTIGAGLDVEGYDALCSKSTHFPPPPPPPPPPLQETYLVDGTSPLKMTGNVNCSNHLGHQKEGGILTWKFHSQVLCAQPMLEESILQQDQLPVLQFHCSLTSREIYLLYSAPCLKFV